MASPVSPAIAPTGRARPGLPLIVAVGVLMVVLGLLVLAASGLGYRAGAWSLHVAFLVLRVGGWIALVGAIFSLLATLLTRPGQQRRGFLASAVALLLGAGAFGWVAHWWSLAQQTPPIHDITTDVANPPTFSAILPLRAGAPNPPDYGGPEIAAQQRAAYPDLSPVILPLPPGSAFRLAAAAARDLGWEVVSSDSAAGRIEATATTWWFGFKDDVVVRVSPDPQGSRVDVRSVSRVGRGDVGTNARRVRSFVERLSRTV